MSTPTHKRKGKTAKRIRKERLAERLAKKSRKN
jgi:hypothetical protein